MPARFLLKFPVSFITLHTWTETFQFFYTLHSVTEYQWISPTKVEHTPLFSARQQDRVYILEIPSFTITTLSIWHRTFPTMIMYFFLFSQESRIWAVYCVYDVHKFHTRLTLITTLKKNKLSPVMHGQFFIIIGLGSGGNSFIKECPITFRRKIFFLPCIIFLYTSWHRYFTPIYIFYMPSELMRTQIRPQSYTSIMHLWCIIKITQEKKSFIIPLKSPILKWYYRYS